MKDLLENLFQSLVDLFFALWPQKKPEAKAMSKLCLVAHRGIHDNRSVFENTLHAFDRAVKHQVWGIEFDVRWTRDLKAVVHHDANTKRVFRRDYQISDMNLKELKEVCPLIPTLEEVVRKCGSKTHLFIELKTEEYPALDKQLQTLKSILSPLTPIKDYHFLALSDTLLKHLKFVPEKTLVLVSTNNTRTMSLKALQRDWGGLAGHYLFLDSDIQKAHQRRGQKTGTGFVHSKNSLYREVNRGVDWIFTNDALRLQDFQREVKTNG